MKIPFFKNITVTSENEGMRLNKKVVTFLFCLLVSTFFWVMMSLSKEYSIDLNFPVTYVNLPPDKVISNHLSETIDIEVKSNGFNLLVYKLTGKKETVLIDIKDAKPLSKKNQYYLLANSRIDKITAQLSNDIRVIRIYPDTIFLNFNKKVKKKVPVKANLSIDFDKEYQQSDSIMLNPAFIEVSGVADLVDKINYVETKPLELKNVNDTLLLRLDILLTPDLKLIDLSPSSVLATVNISKYTEASVELPVEVENLPAGYSLKLFPDKISVKYNVAFQDYEKINALQFHAVVDYLKIEPGSNKLKVQLKKYPPEIRAVKMNPEKVEYIIRK